MALGQTDPVHRRACQVFAKMAEGIYKQTDRLFCGLLLAQWLFVIGCAVIISPYTWAGDTHWVHLHVWAAIFLGGLIIFPPILLTWFYSGQNFVRHAIAIAQMLISALLIHVLGGRIEAHFHVFGSLAFLAFYRDWWVLLTATVVCGADHFLRGVYWPQSVFGVLNAGPYRWVEHVAWVVFENIFLCWSCIKGKAELWTISSRQAEMEYLNEQIEQVVDQRTLQLKETQEQLLQSQKLEAVGRLTGGIAHDFNNILGGILGYSNLLREEFQPGQQASDYLKVIESSAQRGADLIEKLMAFARKGNYQKVSFDVKRILNEAQALLQPILKQKIEVHQTVDPDLWAVVGDPTQLLQVLMNLGVNSYDAMGGVGTLRFRARNVLLEGETSDEKRTLKPGPYVELSVEDTGSGIPEHLMDRIFEPFFTTKEVGKGTGLGLSMVYGILENHGGKVTVRSKLGEGTTFYLFLPAAVDAPRMAEPELSLPRQKSGFKCLMGLKILVVDDNENARCMVSESLERQGAQVQMAENGLQALEIYRKQLSEIDVVLLDVIMPGMEGTEVFTRLVEMHGSVKVIFITGYAESSRISQLRNQYEVGFISKPFRPQTLVEEILKMLRSDRRQNCATNADVLQP